MGVFAFCRCVRVLRCGFGRFPFRSVPFRLVRLGVAASVYTFGEKRCHTNCDMIQNRCPTAVRKDSAEKSSAEKVSPKNCPPQMFRRKTFPPEICSLKKCSPKICPPVGRVIVQHDRKNKPKPLSWLGDTSVLLWLEDIAVFKRKNFCPG